MTDKRVKLYDGILENLLKFHNWSDKFSEKYLDDELQKLIVNIAREKTDERGAEKLVTNHFDKLVNRLDTLSATLVEHFVIVLLAGIEAQNSAQFNERVAIGNITLVLLDDDRMREIIEVYEKILATTPYSNSKRERMVRYFREDFLSHEKGRVCAEFRVVAEPGRAKERADSEIRRVLDWLRYAIPLLYGYGEKSKKMAAGLGLTGEVINRSLERSVVISSRSDNIRFSAAPKGPLQHFGWTKDNIRFLRESGIIDAASLLRNVEFNDFQEALVLGIHWFADSFIQLEKENELLSLITCLESVIPGKDKFDKRSTEGGISHTIAESVATISATTFSEGRKDRDRICGTTKDFILDMYAKRNKITHGSTVEILDRELRELSIMVHRLIAWLIEQHKLGRFSDRNTFFTWIQCNKFKFEHDRLERSLRDTDQPSGKSA